MSQNLHRNIAIASAATIMGFAILFFMIHQNKNYDPRSVASINTEQSVKNKAAEEFILNCIASNSVKDNEDIVSDCRYTAKEIHGETMFYAWADHSRICYKKTFEETAICVLKSGYKLSKEAEWRLKHLGYGKTPPELEQMATQN